jgi:hypothetical protein
MRGGSKAAGSSETFEPVYKDLPGSFHSLENELYFASRKLRELADGECYVHFVGKGKAPAVYAKLTAPLVGKQDISEAQFLALRTRILDESRSAKTTAKAIEHMKVRERAIAVEVEDLKRPLPRAAAQAAMKSIPQPEEPTSWRVAAPKQKLKPVRRSHGKG